MCAIEMVVPTPPGSSFEREMDHYQLCYASELALICDSNACDYDER